MFPPGLLLAMLIGVAPLLGGCGLFVPDIREAGEDNLDEIATENDIVNQIKGEIHRAADQKINGPRVVWLDTWVVKVSLVLTAEEKGALSPGFSLTDPFSAPAKGQFFSLSGGFNASAD